MRVPSPTPSPSSFFFLLLGPSGFQSAYPCSHQCSCDVLPPPEPRLPSALFDFAPLGWQVDGGKPGELLALVNVCGGSCVFRRVCVWVCVRGKFEWLFCPSNCVSFYTVCTWKNGSIVCVCHKQLQCRNLKYYRILNMCNTSIWLTVQLVNISHGQTFNISIIFPGFHVISPINRCSVWQIFYSWGRAPASLRPHIIETLNIGWGNIVFFFCLGVYIISKCY